MRCSARPIFLWIFCLCGLLPLAPAVHANELPEYRLKAAFVYNFALFTEWPAEIGSTLNLCIYGDDPFGKEIDALQGKAVGSRSMAVQRRSASDSLKGCQIVFIAPSAMANLARVLKQLNEGAALTVADTPGACRDGVILNMAVERNKVTFEANLPAARAARLTLSSKLLRLATEVHQ